MDYGIPKTVSMRFEEAVEKVTDGLKQEGFGVLTTIDVKETLKKKLGVDFNKYVILGACNPLFALKALQADQNIGLLLPCNVVVYEKGKETIVAAFNPLAMMSLVDRPEFAPIAQEIKVRLQRVMDAM
jgi:uncharacterized protein (DUF302 family)